MFTIEGSRCFDESTQSRWRASPAPDGDRWLRESWPACGPRACRARDREVVHAQGRQTNTHVTNASDRKSFAGQGGERARGGRGRAIRLSRLHLPGRDHAPPHLQEDQQREHGLLGVLAAGHGFVRQGLARQGERHQGQARHVHEPRRAPGDPGRQAAVLLHARPHGRTTRSRPRATSSRPSARSGTSSTVESESTTAAAIRQAADHGLQPTSPDLADSP